GYVRENGSEIIGYKSSVGSSELESAALGFFVGRGRHGSALFLQDASKVCEFGLLFASGFDARLRLLEAFELGFLQCTE
ncbi:hypothetical protein NL438_26705, partial [Klebsiella pneumoniae]|nr:hypothetical protein [Klebsiella pneumoniae]